MNTHTQQKVHDLKVGKKNILKEQQTASDKYKQKKYRSIFSSRASEYLKCIIIESAIQYMVKCIK